MAGWVLAGLTPGSVLAGYRLEETIGAGGMAVVFRARDERLGRVVALKVLAPGLARDGEFRERFIRESRAAAAVEHPHIIPVYGAGEDSGVLYLAMRLVPGGDLRSVLDREGPLPPGRAMSLLSPVAAALDKAHACGLVHRDVKPANILLDTSPGQPGHPYLSDFGLAKGTVPAASLTGTGQFLGTAGYAAPEQISGGPAHPQTDQYALACVAFTMLAGVPPFSGNEHMAVLWAHMSAPPPPVTAHRRDLPAAVDEVLARALAKNPADRYASCGDFAGALSAALGVPRSTATTPEGREAPRRPRLHGSAATLTAARLLHLSAPDTHGQPTATMTAASPAGSADATAHPAESRRRRPPAAALLAMAATAAALIGTAAALIPSALSKPTAQAQPAHLSTTSPAPVSPSAPSATAQATTAAAPLPAVIDCVTPKLRPKAISLACGDGTIALVGLTWADWTATAATGQGTFWENLCVPDCAEGKAAKYPVAVTLSAVEASPGAQWFSRLTVTWLASRPPNQTPDAYTLPSPPAPH